jgi:mono/diheme cytochrome c family protein
MNALMSTLPRRIAITLAVLSLPFIIGLLVTYEVIKIDWVSYMEIQPSFQPLEDPLPPPPGAVQVQGAAYLPGQGAPGNPVAASQESLARGARHYELNCAFCHGPAGKGDGNLAVELFRKPPDLTAPVVVGLSDGDLFMIISNGLQPVTGFRGGMPGLKENLTVGDRWDIVNFLRSLQSKTQGLLGEPQGN